MGKRRLENMVIFCLLWCSLSAVGMFGYLVNLIVEDWFYYGTSPLWVFVIINVGLGLLWVLVFGHVFGFWNWGKPSVKELRKREWEEGRLEE